jgi:hypothetical protein
MDKYLSAGDRIKVSDKHYWAQGAEGMVTHHPPTVGEFFDGWRGVYREVPSLKGGLIFYWVKFDSPQLDGDGDGPYEEAEIDSNYLLPIGK